MKSIDEVLRNKRVLVFANTPYQMLAACCIALGSQSSVRRMDLAIDPLFENAHELALRVEKAGLFTTVSCDAKYPLTNKHTALKVLKEATHRADSASVRIKKTYPAISNHEYDVMMASYPTLNAFDAKETVCKNAVTWFFDDGSGSRNGNVFTPFCCADDVFGTSEVEMGASKTAKEALKKAFRNPLSKCLSLDIEGIAIYFPTQAEADLYSNIQVIPIEIPEDTAPLIDIFAPNFEQSAYAHKQYYFLTLPSVVNDKLLDAEATLAHRLHAMLGDAFVVRPHPKRSSKDARLKGLPLSSSEDSWEIMIINGLINDDSVLLAYGSTAQMTPKLVGGVEPYVILLSSVLPSIGESKKSIESLCHLIGDRYNDPSKVSMPNNIDELVEILQTAVNKN